jgi:hypothetical protein
MSLPQQLASLSGQWTGSNRLLLTPDTPAAESPTTLTAALTARGKFLTLHYTWAYEGEPQEGLLILGEDAASGVVNSSWVDSFHTADSIMQFRGALNADGATVKGSYSMGDTPPWGWQIAIQPKPDDAFAIIMHNISPEGEHYLAVEASYKRVVTEA